MHTQKLFPVLVICALTGLILFGAAGCGSGGDSGSSTATETVTEGEAGEEAASGGQAGGNAPAPSGDAVRSAKVEITSDAYDPDPVTIEEGGKVTWINRDSAPHCGDRRRRQLRHRPDRGRQAQVGDLQAARNLRLLVHRRRADARHDRSRAGRLSTR